MTEPSVESADRGNWKITMNAADHKYQRTINNTTFPFEINLDVYNYEIYTPVVLAPINKSSTLVLSAYDNHGKLGLRIHDLRFVDEAISASITFTLKGNEYQLGKLKNEMNRVCDSDRCVGILYLFRKIFYSGFRTILADKKLRPRGTDTLQTMLGAVKYTMDQQLEEEDDG